LKTSIEHFLKRHISHHVAIKSSCEPSWNELINILRDIDMFETFR